MGRLHKPYTHGWNFGEIAYAHSRPERAQWNLSAQGRHGNRLHCAPFPHTDPLQKVGQTNKKSRLFSRQKSFRKYSCYSIFSHNSLFFLTAKNYDKETGKCDPYSGGKGSQKKMTSSGPRCCFAQAQTSSYEMLKDKRKWRLKN